MRGILGDAPFFAVAVLAHGFLIAANPVFLASAPPAPAAKALPVDFVPASALSALLAPAPPSAGPAAQDPPAPPPPSPVKKRKLKKKIRPKIARKAVRGPAVARKNPRREARARQLAQVSRELAEIADPDEVLAEARAAAVASELDTLADASEAEGAPDLEMKDALNSLSGASGDIAWSIEGPVGRRRLLSRQIPECPDWVSRRGLDLSAQIRFEVLADGSVKPGAVIKRTSGYPELDRKALEALRSWKFEAVGGSAPAIWGHVTFRFTS